MFLEAFDKWEGKETVPTEDLDFDVFHRQIDQSGITNLAKIDNMEDVPNFVDWARPPES